MKLFNRIYILEKKDFKSIILTRGQQAFSIMAQIVNILGFGGLLQLLNPAIAAWKYHRQYVNKWRWLCYN